VVVVVCATACVRCLVVVVCMMSSGGGGCGGGGGVCSMTSGGGGVLRVCGCVCAPVALFPCQEGGSTVTTLQAKSPHSGAVTFPDMAHGWTVRGDLALPAVSRDVKLAVTTTLDFFEKVL
jgi:hypothetical protein